MCSQVVATKRYSRHVETQFSTAVTCPLCPQSLQRDDQLKVHLQKKHRDHSWVRKWIGQLGRNTTYYFAVEPTMWPPTYAISPPEGFVDCVEALLKGEREVEKEDVRLHRSQGS